jgi:hypothetical protein
MQPLISYAEREHSTSNTESIRSKLLIKNTVCFFASKLSASFSSNCSILTRSTFSCCSTPLMPLLLLLLLCCGVLGVAVVLLWLGEGGGVSAAVVVKVACKDLIEATNSA